MKYLGLIDKLCALFGKRLFALLILGTCLMSYGAEYITLKPIVGKKLHVLGYYCASPNENTRPVDNVNSARFLSAICEIDGGVEILKKAFSNQDWTYLSIYFCTKSHKIEEAYIVHPNKKGEFAIWVSGHLEEILSIVNLKYGGFFGRFNNYNLSGQVKSNQVLIDMFYSNSRFMMEEEEIEEYISTYCRMDYDFVWTTWDKMDLLKFDNEVQPIKINYTYTDNRFAAAAINQSRIFNIISDLYGSNVWENSGWVRLYVVVNESDKKVLSYHLECAPNDSSLYTVLNNNLKDVLSKTIELYKSLYTTPKCDNCSFVKKLQQKGLVLIDIPLVSQYEFNIRKEKTKIIKRERMDKSLLNPNNIVNNVEYSGGCIIE